MATSKYLDVFPNLSTSFEPIQYPENFLDFLVMDTNRCGFIPHITPAKVNYIRFLHCPLDSQRKRDMLNLGKCSHHFDASHWKPNSWDKIKKKLSLEVTGKRNSDARTGFRFGCHFLVKNFFTFGQRTVLPGTLHVFQTLNVPILLYVCKSAATVCHRGFYANEQLHYEKKVLLANTICYIEAPVTYIMVTMQKTLFGLWLLPDTIPLPTSSVNVYQLPSTYKPKVDDFQPPPTPCLEEFDAQAGTYRKTHLDIPPPTPSLEEFDAQAGTHRQTHLHMPPPTLSLEEFDTQAGTHLHMPPPTPSLEEFDTQAGTHLDMLPRTPSLEEFDRQVLSQPSPVLRDQSPSERHTEEEEDRYRMPPPPIVLNNTSFPMEPPVENPERMDYIHYSDPEFENIIPSSNSDAFNQSLEEFFKDLVQSMPYIKEEEMTPHPSPMPLQCIMTVSPNTCPQESSIPHTIQEMDPQEREFRIRTIAESTQVQLDVSLFKEEESRRQVKCFPSIEFAVSHQKLFKNHTYGPISTNMETFSQPQEAEEEEPLNLSMHG